MHVRKPSTPKLLDSSIVIPKELLASAAKVNLSFQIKVVTPRKLKIIREPSPETPSKGISDVKLSSLILPQFRNLTEQKYNSTIPTKKRNTANALDSNKSSNDATIHESKEQKVL